MTIRTAVSWLMMSFWELLMVVTVKKMAAGPPPWRALLHYLGGGCDLGCVLHMFLP